MIDKTNNTNNSFSIESKNGYKAFTPQMGELLHVHLYECGRRDTYLAREVIIEEMVIGGFLARISYVNDNMLDAEVFQRKVKITEYSVDYPYYHYLNLYVNEGVQ